MKFIVINLSGILNSSLAENMKTHVLEVLQEEAVILFDFEKVVSLDPNALPTLLYTFIEVERSGENRFAFSNIKQEILEMIVERVPFNIPTFNSKDEAKKYLEELHDSSKHSVDSGLFFTQYTKVSEFTQKGDIYYIFCPGCGVKLRIRSIGNHACPSCKTRFLFKPEKSEIITDPKEKHYNMLSLD